MNNIYINVNARFWCFKISRIARKLFKIIISRVGLNLIPNDYVWDLK